MSESHIQFEPSRRTGEQQARYGTGQAISGFRQLRTPNELAAAQLNKELSLYKEFTKDGRRNLQNEFVDMSSLRTMNMKVFAATLSFLNGFNNNITVNSFKDANILPYIKPLLSSSSTKQDKKRLIIRFKSLILSYIKAIAIYRAE